MRKIIRAAVWTQIKTGYLSAAELIYHYLHTLWHRLMSDLFISLHEIFFDFSSSYKLFSLCQLSLARSRSPQVCRMFHEPFIQRVHKQTETHIGTSVFLILCFQPVGAGEPWQPNTEGRKICALPGRAPSLWQSCLNSWIPWQKQHSTSKW